SARTGRSRQAWSAPPDRRTARARRRRIRASAEEGGNAGIVWPAPRQSSAAPQPVPPTPAPTRRRTDSRISTPRIRQGPTQGPPPSAGNIVHEENLQRRGIAGPSAPRQSSRWPGASRRIVALSANESSKKLGRVAPIAYFT